MLDIYIEKLIDKQNLQKQETEQALQGLLQEANLYQTAAFLVLLRSKGETSQELAGMVEAMRKHAIPVHVDLPLLDIVGTGGDKAKTVNISTAAAILAASCGVPVAKHGNRSVSSLSGSADVLDALGVKIDLTPEEVARSIKELGIGFMFAPRFHPMLQALAPMRRGLKIPTAFNILGPLLNPACAKYQLIGVYKPHLVPLMAEALCHLGTKHALVFHGCGLDELSPLGVAEGIEVRESQMRPVRIDPQSFGIQKCALDELQGGQAIDNARILESVFAGEKGPVADAIVLNAGIGLWLYGKAEKQQEGVQIARQNLDNGSALRLLEAWKNFKY